jgi:hypothetical protein
MPDDAMKPLDPISDDDFERLLHQAVALPDAPPALLHRVRGLWPAAPAGGALQAAIRHVAALLSFDSWAAPAAAAGVRAPRAATRHLLYSAEGRDIDLRIAPSGASFALAGQVLGPDEGGEVELASATGAPARRAAVDALGEFRIEDVGAGDYGLTLRLGGDEIVLPTLHVGAPAM